MVFTTSVENAIQKADVIFIAVGTPEKEDGSADMTFTFNVLTKICESAKTPKTVVLKSTVPIGTAREAQDFCHRHASIPIEIVNNPEFLRQGNAVDDFMNPDRIVIGCQSKKTENLMTTIYEPFLKNGFSIIFMDNASAEMTKYAANCFLALKISYINEISLLADLVGADINQVKKGFTSDNRINPAFFHPGIGYGGSCFPKDVRALIHTGQTHDLDLKLIRAADEVNERQKSVLVNRLKNRLQDLKDRTICLWGLSFKPNTDDIRRAPSLVIIRELLQLGAHVQAFDPIVKETAQLTASSQFQLKNSALEASRGADALLLLTEWNEFKSVDLLQLKSHLKTPLFFDGRNIFDPKKMTEIGFEYYGIGRQSLTQKQSTIL